MGVIWTKRQRNKQAQNSKAPNNGNPLFQNIQFCYSLDSKTSEVTNKTIGVVTAESVRQPTNTKFGPAIGAKAGSITAYETLSNVSLGSSYTLLSFQLGSSGVQQNILDDDNGGTRGFQYRISNTNTFEFITFTIGGSAVSVASAALTTKQLTSGFVAVASVSSSGAISVWVDGVKTPGSLGGTPRSPMSSIAVLNRKNGGTQFPALAPVLLVAGWSRVLSEPEVISLSQNPWQLFSQELRPLGFDVVVGGSPYSMDAEAGAYTLTGVDATFKASRALTAEAGSYSLTGVAATFQSSRTIVAEAGSYAVSGQDATFTYTPVSSGSPYSMDAEAGAYTVTGVDATFKASRTIVAEAGSYALTGIDASFTRSEYRLVAEAGSYVIAGQEVTFSTTGTVTPTGGRGGNGTGRNLSRKQKKKLKAVESQEWLKAEETARQLLSDRFTKQTPQEKAQALETYVESLQPVIEALRALSTQVEEVAEQVEDIPVIEITPHQEILQRFDRLEKKVKSVEELIIILMADL